MNASRGGRLVFSLLGLAAAVAALQAPVRGQCPSCSSPAAPLTCQGQEYRLVYQTVYEQHQVTAYRIEYETVYRGAAGDPLSARLGDRRPRVPLYRWRGR